MRASINKTLDKLEDLLLSEAKMIGKKQIERGNSEISKWQSHVRAVNDQTNLFAVAQQHGAEIHKCIAAKTALKTINEVNNNIRQVGNQLNLENVSCEFDKNVLLQNTSVSINNNRITLAGVDQDRKVQNSNQFHQLGMTAAPSYYGPCPTNSFFKVSVDTTVHQMPQYNPGQPLQRGYWGYQ